MTTLSIDLKNRCLSLAFEKTKDPTSASHRWIQGAAYEKEAAIEELFQLIKKEADPSFSSSFLHGCSLQILTQLRSVSKCLDYLAHGASASSLNEQEKEILSADPEFMKRALNEALEKSSLPTSLDLSFCRSHPGDLSELASVWNRCIASAQKWKETVLSPLIQRRERSLQTDYAIRSSALQSLPRLHPSAGLSTKAYLDTLDHLHENPITDWLALTRFSSFLEPSLSWYTIYATSPSPNPSGLTKLARELFVNLSEWKSYYHRLLTSDEERSKLSTKQIALLEASIDSQLVVFKLREIFERNMHYLFVENPSTSHEATTRRSLHSSALFAIREYTLPDGRAVPLVKKLEFDLNRSPGPIFLITHGEDGAGRIKIPHSRTAPTDTDSEIERKMDENIAILLSHLLSLSGHKDHFDRRLNELVQLLISQEGYGLRVGDALFWSTKEGRYTLKKPNIQIEIHDHGPKHVQIDIRYIGKIGLIGSDSDSFLGDVDVRFGYEIKKGFLGTWNVETSPIEIKQFSLDPSIDECFTSQNWEEHYTL